MTEELALIDFVKLINNLKALSDMYIVIGGPLITVCRNKKEYVMLNYCNISSVLYHILLPQHYTTQKKKEKRNT